MLDTEHQSPPTLSLQRRIWKELKGYLEAVVIALIVTTFLFTTVGVAGGSMDPTLDGGSGRLIESLLKSDRLFIPKYETWLRRTQLLGHYQRGDIIIFREPADSPYVGKRRDFLVKRLIGLPGDRIRIEAGEVFINGNMLNQGFITTKGGHIGFSNLPEVIVPEEHYFVLGDNRSNSVDSRVFGFIPFMSVAGKASAVIWPPFRDGELNWHKLSPPATFTVASKPKENIPE